MEKLFDIIMLAIAVLISCNYANAETIKNANNASIGYINSDGSAKINHNSLQFKIYPDGTIRNNNNTIGKLDGNRVRNRNNATIGSISNDGTVRNNNNNNQTIGKISNDGTVRNNNQTIGYAKGVKKEWTAIFFFFIDKLK